MKAGHNVLKNMKTVRGVINVILRRRFVKLDNASC